METNENNKEEVEKTQKEVNDKEKPNEIQTQAIAKLDNFTNTLDLYNLAKILCESNLLPQTYNTPEKAIVCIAQGRELGLPALTSLYNMYFIAGRPVLSIHAIMGLLSKNKVAYQTDEDFVKIETKEGEPHNARTTITFFRKNEYLNIVIKETISYTWKEATAAGLTEKEVWIKYKKNMLWNRCATFGAKRIAPDIILGVMEISEAGDTFNKKYSVDKEGNTIIDITENY